MLHTPAALPPVEAGLDIQLVFILSRCLRYVSCEIKEWKYTNGLVDVVTCQIFALDVRGSSQSLETNGLLISTNKPRNLPSASTKQRLPNFNRCFSVHFDK